MSLLRPVPFSNAAVQEKAAFTKERYGSVARVYIVCDQDNVIQEDLQRWVIGKLNPPDEVKGGWGMEGQRHFVLVHGACHGAWCWYKVAALLKSAGHKVTAMDLGASGVNPKQVQDLHSISDYFEPLMEFMKSLGEDERVILVGHSMGGVGISFAMERFPEKVAAAVFPTGSMPGPDLSYTTMREEVLFSRFLLDKQESHQKLYLPVV
ncbi:hypothetical protein Tsubulata_034131 [Turnera subulata]|uniref:AB hydrolase-1 domain-containing protein n=1 Tax=Turnera subulata TaxID=218843 RepID=A0A9Q0JMY9_9ROSI|nr:hypothetical protein Tsubulata_034131 [Turnera subulata]